MDPCLWGQLEAGDARTEMIRKRRIMRDLVKLKLSYKLLKRTC